jgi:hypothetical protein
MFNIEQFSDLVGDIYDAALDPALWPGVFMRACNFVGASAAALATHDIVRRSTAVFYNWGFAPGYEKIYAESCCKINPFFPTAIFFDLETVFAPVPMVAAGLEAASWRSVALLVVTHRRLSPRRRPHMYIFVATTASTSLNWHR